jgi:hypothetical protein
MAEEGHAKPANQNGEILDRLYRSNAGVRKIVQRELKKENPALVFPELEIEDAVEKVSETFGKKLEDTSNELQRERAARARDKVHQQWKDEGYEPDDVEAVIREFGLEGSNDPFKAAKKILDAQRVVAVNEANVKDNGRMRVQDDWKAIMSKPDAVITAKARDIAHAAVDDVIAARRAEASRFRPTK